MQSFSPSPSLIEQAVQLARGLQERATALQTPQERRQQAELDRMLQNPADKVTLIELTDQAFRSRTAARKCAVATCRCPVFSSRYPSRNCASCKR